MEQKLMCIDGLELNASFMFNIFGSKVSAPDMLPTVHSAQILAGKDVCDLKLRFSDDFVLIYHFVFSKTF